MSTVKEQSHRQRSLSSLLVMAATLSTRILGFVKFAVISAFFGGQGVVDVLNAVLSIPNNLRKLMAEGSLSTAFVPSISRLIVEGKTAQAQQLTRSIMGLQWLVLLPIVLIFMFFSQQMIPYFVHFADHNDMVLAGHLLYWVAPYILIISLAAVLMAVLNSHNRFLVSALAPLLFSVAIMGCIFIWGKSLGVYSMALGVLIGGLLQLLIQYLSFGRLGYSILPSFKFRVAGMKDVMLRWGPILVTSSVFAINQQIAVNLASRLPTGSSTALANAVVFFQLPFGVFSASVNTVYYPQISRYVSANNHAGVAESLSSGMRQLLVLLLPASFFLIFMGKEIISVAFLRGAFRVEHVEMAAKTLVAFSYGMFFTAGYNFIQRYYYAKGYMWLPVISATVACTIDVILSLLWMHSYGVVGLAYANTVAFGLSFITLMIALKFIEPQLKFSKLGWDFFKLTLVLFGMWLVYRFIIVHFFGDIWWQQTASWSTFVLLSISMAILGGVFLILSKIFSLHVMVGLRKSKKM